MASEFTMERHPSLTLRLTEETAEAIVGYLMGFEPVDVAGPPRDLELLQRSVVEVVAHRARPDPPQAWQRNRFRSPLTIR